MPWYKEPLSAGLCNNIDLLHQINAASEGSGTHAYITGAAYNIVWHLLSLVAVGTLDTGQLH